ncbi:MAG: 16S rRNA (guanine(527)-N(7))-methyltransferase RsmG [Solirubrobacteraceae bacterium]
MSSEERALAALTRAHGLPTTARPGLSLLLDALADPEAPTKIHARKQAIDAHLADSLVALEIPEVAEAGVIADLGAGAGLPGLALAVALPGAQMTLVESTGRKCAYLERTIDSMGLSERASVVCERAEAWPAGIGRFDVVAARALAALPVLVEYAAPLLRVGGSLVAWKGRRVREEEAAGVAAAEILGMELTQVRRVRPYADAHYRHLHVLRKVRATPSGYPRRPGMAVKRPLAAPESDRVRQ